MIICASLPSLRKFLNHLCPKLLGDRPSNSAGALPFGPNGDLATWGQYSKRPKPRRNDTLYGLGTIIDVQVLAGRADTMEEDAGDHLDSGRCSQEGILPTHAPIVATYPAGSPPKIGVDFQESRNV